MGRVRYHTIKSELLRPAKKSRKEELHWQSNLTSNCVCVCVCLYIYIEGLLWPGSIRRSVSLITPTLTSLSTGLGTYLKTPGATWHKQKDVSQPHSWESFFFNLMISVMRRPLTSCSCSILILGLELTSSNTGFRFFIRRMSNPNIWDPGTIHTCVLLI